MKFFVPVFALIFSLNAAAEIFWTGVEGVSQKQGFGVNNNSSVVLFGGFAGTPNFRDTDDIVKACNTRGGSNTCNNCGEVLSLLAPTACNQNRAYDELEVSFTFSSTSVEATGGIAKITTRNNDGQEVLVDTGSVLILPNQTVTLTTTWRKICSAINNAPDPAFTSCEGISNKSQPFRIGLAATSDFLETGEGNDSIPFTVVVHDPDTTFDTTSPSLCTGLCNFSLFPGDEKAYIENDQIGTSVRPIEKVHLLCQSETNGGFASIVKTDICATLQVENNSLTEDSITDLKNGETYSFFAATEDDAGNIGHFLTETTTCPGGASILPGLTSCRQVKPDQVSGLFKDNCFIATAAFGSPLEPHVKTLRKFRNKYLSTHSVGQSFIRFYYSWSPPLAHWIGESENRKFAARLALTPVVFLVRAFMAAPFVSFLIGILSAFLLALFVFRKIFKNSILNGPRESQGRN